MEKLYIPVIEGTVRPKRESIHAARLIVEVGKTIPEIEVELIDPMDFDLPFDGNDSELQNALLDEITKRADAYFLVFPEYNHSFPGTLKKVLDNTNLSNYIHKPVALAGVSSGPWGGVRAIEAVVLAVRESGMAVTFTDVQFPYIQNLFDENGKLLDEKYIGRIKKSYDELIWMAKTLKYGRENIPSQYHEIVKG